MGLTMEERRAVTKEVAKRYQKASKKQKGKILEGFIVLMGYNRSYASHILSNWGRKVFLKLKGETVAIIFGMAKTKRHRQRYYDNKVVNVLRSIWIISDYLCGKRLSPLLKEIIPQLEKFGEIKLDAKMRKKPYQRVLNSKHIDSVIKRKLKRLYKKLNPAELKRNITNLQNKLMKLVTSKLKIKKRSDFFYNFHEATK